MEITRSEFTENGFDDRQAFALVNALSKMRDETVTKDYLRAELAVVRLEHGNAISKVRSEMRYCQMWCTDRLSHAASFNVLSSIPSMNLTLATTSAS